MNLFNEAIYKNHLEHTAAGTKWGKHKYLYITPSGRYVYPEDVRNGQSAEQFRSRQINDQIKSAHSNATSSKMDLTPGSELKAQQRLRDLNRGPEGRRSMRYTGSAKDIEDAHRRDQYIRERTFGKGPGTDELERQIQKTAERKKREAAAKTSGVAAGSKSVASNAANRNTVTIKSEDKKTETTTSTSTKDKGKYKNMSEETKAWLEKEAAKGEKKEETKKGSGKKGGSGKKKGSSSSSKKSSSKTERETASQTGGTTRAATEESKELGLTEEDLNNMEINTEATNRDEVIKNLALKVIRGDFGNGPERKEKLGKFYGEIQKRVNEMLKEKKVIKHYDLEEGLFLKHWGKKRRSGRYAFGSGDRPYQHESNKRYTRKNSSFRDRRRMTDEELLNATIRAKREVDLYKAERDNRSQGQIFVEDVLRSVGKSVIIGAATGGLKYAGKKFVESALGDQELANAMFSNNGGGGKKKNKHKD